MNENIHVPEAAMPDVQMFRETIAGLKRIEEEKRARGESSTAHFQWVNPEELLEEDARIYQKYLDNDLTKEEFIQYRKQFDHVSIEDSRHGFAAYIGNKLAVRFLQKEIDERKALEGKNDQK